MTPVKAIPSVVPAALVIVLAIAQPSLAQVDTLIRIQPGVADVEPNARSLLVQPVDLRSSVGFDILYQGTWSDPILGTRDVFARRQGALTAVFPRSSYVRTEAGIVPEIPAGTIFYIGDPPPTLESLRKRLDLDATTNGRRDLRLETSMPQEHRPPELTTETLDLTNDMSIWRDESYRQARVSRLIRAAAQAEKIQESDPDSSDS